jgi:polyphosphate kinase
VMNALLNAANNGKEVTVVMELQARFDEANNMYWSERLKEEGVKVIFGSQGSKVHSKLIYVTRESGGKEQCISFIGTGNFNENTAKFYTDLGLFTANESICQEVAKVFKVLENKTQRDNYKYLLVSPFNNRKKIVDLIEQEISNAQNGLKAGIYLKINNLVDNKLINKLYEASKAGVSIKLLVRGVCCLVPGEKKFSENIEVISIVDRYLEHSRFMIFENNQQPLYFITSADWMERNLDKRIEVAVPILDKNIQSELQFIFNSYWSDTIKARRIDSKMKNKYRKKSTDELEIEAQRMVYHYYQQKLN